jgi:hypothetical protein
MYAMLLVLTTQERTLFQAISTELTTESQGKSSNSNDIPLPFTIVDDEGPIIIWSVSVDKLPTIQNSEFTAEVVRYDLNLDIYNEDLMLSGRTGLNLLQY